MKKVMFQDKYPIITMKIKKEETSFSNINEIVKFLSEKIISHKQAQYIGLFDHCNHTKSLEEGEINKDIKDAKNIIFCFGVKLPNPEVMAVRPRSIGVCEFENKFVLSFMEAPVLEANETMKSWIAQIRNK